MALLHQTTMSPTKLELLTAWLPTRDWFSGPAGDAQQVATFRFDDPEGEVGIETILVRVGDGPVHQVPLTYRGAPLAGGDDWLVGMCEHGVLGRRWVYDAIGDPLYAAVLAGAVHGHVGQAELVLRQQDGRTTTREQSMSVACDAPEGTPMPAVTTVVRVVDGDPTVIVTDAVELAVVRRVDAGTALEGLVLTGEWGGQAPVALACAS